MRMATIMIMVTAMTTAIPMFMVAPITIPIAQMPTIR